MRWILGILHFLSFIAMWLGGSTICRASFAPYLQSIGRMPAEIEVLASIGWIGIAIFLQLVAIGIFIGDRHTDRADQIEGWLSTIHQTLNKIGRALKQQQPF